MILMNLMDKIMQELIGMDNYKVILKFLLIF